MLEALRSGAQTWVAKLLFGLLVFSFAIWGIADVFTGLGRGSIANVGTTAISAEEFQRAYQNELDRFSREAKQRITPDQGRAIGLDRRVMAQLVGGAAIENHARQLGLGLSDKTLVEGIQSDSDFKGPDGKFSKQYFDGLLRQVGMSEQGFMNLRRKDELRSQMIGALIKGLTVPKPMLEIQHAYNEEKRVIEWMTIDSDKAVTVAEPDDVKLKERYEASKSKYMTPEYRKLEVLSLTVDDLKKQVTVTDEEILQAYAATKDSYDKPEQRRVQQIAFKDKASADAAKKALDDGSKSFGDVAKDAGAKDTDADLGLIAKKSLIDAKIADVAFSLTKDTFSDVVEGRFATVILRVTQIEPGAMSTLDGVKAEVRDKLAAEKAKGEIQKKHDEIDDQRAAGKTLKDIADALKLSFNEVAAADSKGMGPDGKPALATPDLPVIISRAFAPDSDSEDAAVDLSGGGSAWVNVLGTDAPKQRPFEEVKETVKGDYMVSESQRLVSELATKLVERLNAGEAMSALEAAASGKAEKTEPVTRSTIPQGLTEAAVGQGFVLAKGRASSSETSDRSSRTIFRVSDITPAPVPTKEQLDKLAAVMEGDLANQVLSEYTEGLKQRLGATINNAELKRALGTTDQ